MRMPRAAAKRRSAWLWFVLRRNPQLAQARRWRLCASSLDLGAAFFADEDSAVVSCLNWLHEPAQKWLAAQL